MGDGVYFQFYQVIQGLLWAYGYVLIGTAVISWIPDLLDSQLGRILVKLTDPYLQLFRRFIPSVHIGGVLLDLSFVVGVVVYFLLQNIVLSVLLTVIKGMFPG